MSELRSRARRVADVRAVLEPGTWVFYRLRPLRAQAYRGYSELQGREVMRDSHWLQE